MSNVEQSGPGGVTKRYGALGLGGTEGVTQGASGDFRVVYEFDAIEAAAAETYKFRIPASYAVITGVKIEVEEAFDAGTVDLLLSENGGTPTTVLSGPADLTTAGIGPGGLATNPTPIASDPDGDGVYDELTVVTDSITGTVGYAKVIVTVERV